MAQHLFFLGGQTSEYVKETNFLKPVSIRPPLKKAVNAEGERDREIVSSRSCDEVRKLKQRIRELEIQLHGTGNTPLIFRANRGPRVLCLDGGGVRGLVEIEVLHRIERATGKKNI